MATLNERLARNLKMYRTAQGLSRESLAYLCGNSSSSSMLYKIEHGLANCTLLTVEKYAKALGIDPLELLKEV